MAKLYFRYGAMNSGKSTALMQVAHNYEEQGMRVLILKPQVDTKGGGELVSRLGVRRKADLLIPPETDVFEAVRQANSTAALACVLCDESQFFTPEQAEQLFMVTVELNIPVICLSQLSRANEKRDDKRPMLSDLRESGAIEQDADVVMFIHREGYYDPETADKNVGEIIIAKQRNGPLGTVKVAWLSEYTTYTDLPPSAMGGENGGDAPF